MSNPKAVTKAISGNDYNNAGRLVRYSKTDLKDTVSNDVDVDAEVDIREKSYVKNLEVLNVVDGITYNVLVTDEMVSMNAGTTGTINLCSAVEYGAGRIISLFNEDPSNIINVSTFESETIDGGSTFAITNSGVGVFFSDGSNWIRIRADEFSP